MEGVEPDRRPCAPVLLLVFNRLDTVVEVLDAIAHARPDRLYIASDGGRDSREHEQVERVRESVLKRIDWECHVTTLFRDANLGCRRAVSEAITWFFDKEAAGIVLEDDCLPHASFFDYCTRMLEQYAGNQNVATIAGSRFFCYDTVDNRGMAIRSRVFHCWGWAGWAEKWKQHDGHLPTLDKLASRCGFRQELVFWKRIFALSSDAALGSWDYKFSVSCFENGCSHILPPVNLVINLGFGGTGTHSNRRPWLVPYTFDEYELVENSVCRFKVSPNVYDRNYYTTQFRSLPVRLFQRVMHYLKWW